MHKDSNILLISMPFAGITIPSIQLALLETYLKQRNVDIFTNHYYLKAAEIYGINNYNFLIQSPNESYIAQMAFSKYVFPDNWEKNKDLIKKYYQKNILRNKEEKTSLRFSDYLKKTDKVYDFIIKNTNWENFDIIGFTLNYGQLLPSLAVAKKIKKNYSNKKIVLGGSRTVGKLGIKALELFPYIDYIVSGDGEDSIYNLSKNKIDLKNIPGLIYRTNGSIEQNTLNNNIILDSLPIPNYDTFYKELSFSSDEIKQNFMYYGHLPVEISRGCFWNKCSFCNMNIQHNRYREKSVDNIIEEIDFLSNKYKILNFQIIGNTLPQKNYKELFEKLKSLGKDLKLIAETRAGRLKSKDYTLMKDAGFSIIQTGVESFSQNYLNKMKKGVRVIDNLAALKYSKENDIQNHYNLIINYPNEENTDFIESKKNIEMIKTYLDPPKISQLKVVYGNDIYNNPYNYGVEKLDLTEIDKLMFPQNFKGSGFNFVYNFKSENKIDIKKWYSLVNDWVKKRNKLILEGTNSQNDIDKYIFYFLDGKEFVKIVDKRNTQNINVFILDKSERDVFLNCIDVVSFKELKDRLPKINHIKLQEILDVFVENRIVFKDNDRYLSLPLDYKKITGKKSYKENFKEKREKILA